MIKDHPNVQNVWHKTRSQPLIYEKEERRIYASVDRIEEHPFFPPYPKGTLCYAYNTIGFNERLVIVLGIEITNVNDWRGYYKVYVQGHGFATMWHKSLQPVDS